MFFVFHHTLGWDLRNGGLGDLDMKTKSRDGAISRARKLAAEEPSFSTEILDGETGEVMEIDAE